MGGKKGKSPCDRDPEEIIPVGVLGEMAGNRQTGRATVLRAEGVRWVWCVVAGGPQGRCPSPTAALEG